MKSLISVSVFKLTRHAINRLSSVLFSEPVPPTIEFTSFDSNSNNELRRLKFSFLFASLSVCSYFCFHLLITFVMEFLKFSSICAPSIKELKVADISP